MEQRVYKIEEWIGTRDLFFKGGKCLCEVFKKIVFEFMYSINVYVWLLLFFISEFELIG